MKFETYFTESEEVWYHGSPSKFESSKDMPQGHRGYFATKSPKIARKFGPYIHKMVVKTDKIFDANNPKHEKYLHLLADRVKHLNKMFGKEGQIRNAKAGAYRFYEDWQVQNALENMGFEGNYQVEDGEPVIRLFHRKSFNMMPITESAQPTMTLWHGGNLKNGLTDTIVHKKGKWEYGPGLYLTTHYHTATRYAKGSRRLYKVTIEKGNNADDVYIDLPIVMEFVNSYVLG